MKFKTQLTTLLLISLSWSQSPMVERYKNMLNPARNVPVKPMLVSYDPQGRNVRPGTGEAELLDSRGSVGTVNTQQRSVNTQSPILIKVDDFYGIHKDSDGYHLEISDKQQTIIRLEGTIYQKEGYHRVTWKSDKTYLWSNGMVTDEFKVVNPASYSKNGKVYTMFGPLPEMKGSSVLITATYGPYTDSIIIHLY